MLNVFKLLDRGFSYEIVINKLPLKFRRSSVERMDLYSFGTSLKKFCVIFSASFLVDFGNFLKIY